MFHSWPGWYQVLWGATWGNNDAALQWTVVIALASFFGRKYWKKLGRKLADSFRGPLHDHIEDAFSLHHENVKTALDEHHNRIMDEVNKLKDKFDGKEDT